MGEELIGAAPDPTGFDWRAARHVAVTWTFTTQEWAASSFSEGIATFAADSALYFPDAASPTSCLSSGACTPFSSWSLEANETSCSSGQQRFPFTTIRYLWDVYDTVNDGESVPEGPCCYWMMMGVLASYPSGTGGNQADEPWNSNYTGLDARDGRGTNSWGANYNAAFGRFWTAPQNLHCNPL